MTGGPRIGLLLATVAALVAAFVLLSPGDDEPTTTPTTPTRPGAATAPGGDTPQTAAVGPAAPAPPAAQLTRIRVQSGEAAGGVKTIKVKKGRRARILISSQDTSDDVHLHGYDLTRRLEPGGSARLSFVADAEGIFEIELHGTGTQIGSLVVEP